MDSLSLALRVGLSLACVLGLIWLVSKGFLTGGARRTRTRPTHQVAVLSRQSLSRTSSVAVVQVGDRALVLGVTEQHVTLLSETDLPAVVPVPAAATTLDVTEIEDLEVAKDATQDVVLAPSTLPRQRRRPAAAGGPLAGSALSPATWSTALDLLRDRTTRR